jgi:NodT family efflux transporter outer membrane factor (OMF) lipoprotein
LLLPPILAFSLATCAVGPDYSRPAAPVPTKFKELKALSGWKLAAPSDAFNRGEWWAVYHDRGLDRLMRQVEVSNQTVAQQAAAYENARALIRQAQAGLFPTVSANYSATRSSGFGGGGSSRGLGNTTPGLSSPTNVTPGGPSTTPALGGGLQGLTAGGRPAGAGSGAGTTSGTAQAMAGGATAGADPPAGGGFGGRGLGGGGGGSGTGSAGADPPSSATGAGTAGGGSLGGVQTTFVPELDATWVPDVWGKTRRQIESSTSAAQLSAADLANVKLAEQALLATAYFNLRAADALYDLFGRTITQYRRTLQIVQNQFNAGYSVTAGDVATARAQVETTQGMQLLVSAQRAPFEHAIAMLIGRPPAELTIAHRSLRGTIPKVPLTVPSTLLERRPDIAAAERMMQQQNAVIGVAEAAFYPTISLSALIGWQGTNPLPFTAANEFWSLGAAAAQPIFEGGLLSAQLDSARATYWQSVANYRQTVLTAFQGVEDELANIRYQTQALRVQEQAVKDARTAVEVFLNQFQAGTVAYTSVVQAQIILLGDEQTALTTRQDLFQDSVLLIQNLGGTWDTTLLPTQKELKGSISFWPQLPTH